MPPSSARSRRSQTRTPSTAAVEPSGTGRSSGSASTLTVASWQDGGIASAVSLTAEFNAKLKPACLVIVDHQRRRMRERPWRQNMTATLLFLVNFALLLCSSFARAETLITWSRLNSAESPAASPPSFFQSGVRLGMRSGSERRAESYFSPIRRQRRIEAFPSSLASRSSIHEQDVQSRSRQRPRTIRTRASALSVEGERRGRSA